MVVEVVIARRLRNEQQKQPDHGAHLAGVDKLEALGARSEKEIQRVLIEKDLRVSQERLLERTHLEKSMRVSLANISVYLIALFSFMSLVMDISPAGALASVHSWQRQFLQMDSASMSNIKTLDDVYTFIESMSQNVMLLTPTDEVYWCDPRYLDPVGLTQEGVDFCLENADSPLCVGATPAPTANPPAGGHRRASSLDENKLHYRNPTSFGEATLHDCSVPSVIQLYHKAEAFAVTLKDSGMTEEQVADVVGSKIAKHAFPTAASPAAGGGGHGAPAPSPTTTPSPAHRRMATVWDPELGELLAHLGLEDWLPVLCPASMEGESCLLENLMDETVRTSGLPMGDRIRLSRLLLETRAHVSAAKRRLSGAPAPAPGGGHGTVETEHLGPHAKYGELQPDDYVLQTGAYLKKAKYSYQQLALLPLLAYQTRFKERKCVNGSYASTYNSQAHRELIPMFGMNAGHSDELLDCVDRDNMSDWAYEAEIDSDSFLFNGERVFTRFANLASGVNSGGPIQPHWTRMGFLDQYTSTVVASVLLYTPASEIFTSLSVAFEIDEVGTVGYVVDQKSFVDVRVTGRDGPMLIATVFAVIFAGLGALYTLVQLTVRKQRDFKTVFELISRTCIAVFAIHAYVGFSAMVPMAKEYDDVLTTFLTLKSFSHTGLVAAVEHFFSVKTHIGSEVEWISNTRIIGNIIFYAQFFQLILYLDIHPRMGMLGRTLARALDHMLHFFLLFALLLSFMGFVVHWGFAGLAGDTYGSMGATMLVTFELLIGGFDFSVMDSARGLEWTMFFLWYVLFVVLMFFVLLNFFLAIVVDAFVVVKQAMSEQVTELSFFGKLRVT